LQSYLVYNGIRKQQKQLKILKQKTMKTRIFTMVILLMAGTIFYSNSAFAGRKNAKLASSLENATDPSIQIESWMTSDFIWNQGIVLEMNTVSEESVELENWMVNTFFWDRFEDAQDYALPLEVWMTSQVIWEKVEGVTEPVLSLEDWMLDVSFWDSGYMVIVTESEETLKLEDWMTNNDIWNS
jgi:hypothetical protein